MTNEPTHEVKAETAATPPATLAATIIAEATAAAETPAPTPGAAGEAAGTPGASPEAAQDRPPATEAAKPAADTPSPQADCKRFVDAFGPQGATWWMDGKTFAQAQELHTAGLKEQRDKLVAENAELKARVTLDRGATAPVSFSPAATPTTTATAKMAEKVGTNLARFAAGLKYETKTTD